MAEKQETHADIIAEMRMFKCRDLETGKLELCNAIGSYFADRLEAAHKREINALTEELDTAKHCWKVWSDRADELLSKCNEQFAKLKTLGNAAKLREALVSVQKKIHYLIGSLNVPNSLVANRMEINGIINAALAAPPRNCDVGTAEEQEKRYNEWLNADVGRAVLGLDPLEWAQMPYEEGGAK